MPQYRAIVHCSDSEWGTVNHVTKWHTDPKPKGRGWRDIGYHAIIENGYPTHSHWKDRDNRAVPHAGRLRLFNGSVSMGRPWDADAVIEADEVGAHAYGHNRDTLGVCLIGKRRFTRNQFIALIKLLQLWRDQFGVRVDDILGHYEVDTHGKTCPNLDMGIVRDLVRNKSDAFRLMDELKPKEAL
jgi:hypothetical protein